MFDFINDFIMYFKPFPGGFDMEMTKVWKEMFEFLINEIISKFA